MGAFVRIFWNGSEAQNQRGDTELSGLHGRTFERIWGGILGILFLLELSEVYVFGNAVSSCPRRFRQAEAGARAARIFRN